MCFVDLILFILFYFTDLVEDKKVLRRFFSEVTLSKPFYLHRCNSVYVRNTNLATTQIKATQNFQNLTIRENLTTQNIPKLASSRINPDFSE